MRDQHNKMSKRHGDPSASKKSTFSGISVSFSQRAWSWAATAVLEALPAWTLEGVHDALIGLAETLRVKNATLLWPVRIALAGKLVTPGGAVEI